MDTGRWIWGLGVIALLFTLTGCRGERSAAQTTGASAEPVAERVITGLQEPVSLVFLSRSTWLVAERRSGRIRVIRNEKLLPEPFAVVTVPNPPGYHEYGLLSLAVHPDYPDPPYVYAFHTVAAGNRANGQRIVRFTVRGDKGTAPTTIVDGLPAGTSCCHNGGRLAFGADGNLYVTVGDTQREALAQDYESLAGKVLRYAPDGTIPADNPMEQQRTQWVDQAARDPQQLSGLRTPVYTMGHRNPFGITLNRETGELYITENGPDRGDEINRLVAGDNYGWPEVVGASNNPRFRAPLWSSGNTTTAPTGLAFYTGDDLPHYRGQLFFANYKDGKLRRAVLEGRDRITAVSVVGAAGANAKLDVAMGPDGHLYFTSMNAIYRLRAKE